MSMANNSPAEAADLNVDIRHAEALLKTGAIAKPMRHQEFLSTVAARLTRT